MNTFKLTLIALLLSLIIVLRMLATALATTAASVALSTPLPASISASTTISYTSYPMNPGTKYPYDMVRGSDNNVWFFEKFDTGDTAIARITPDGTITDFLIPNGPSQFSAPVHLAVGPDGNLWYPQWGTGKIGRMTLTGIVTTFPISGTSSTAIAAGPDGNLWVSEASNYKIERITLDGVITGQFTIPSSDYPIRIVVGGDNNLWFNEGNRGKIGRITINGAITEFPITDPNVYYINDLTLGSDGNIWFTEMPLVYVPNCPVPGKIGKITPSGMVTEYGIQCAPEYIASGPDGNIWFTIRIYHSNTFAGIAPDGKVVALGSVSYAPDDIWGTPLSAITSGGDGKIWTALLFSRRILALSTSRPYHYYFPLIAK